VRVCVCVCVGVCVCICVYVCICVCVGVWVLVQGAHFMGLVERVIKFLVASEIMANPCYIQEKR
jgi:hypothetical protein